jgi:hypothetical protein
MTPSGLHVPASGLQRTDIRAARSDDRVACAASPAPPGGEALRCKPNAGCWDMLEASTASQDFQEDTMLMTAAAIQTPEKPGRLLLAIMAWQRQLVEQQQAHSIPEALAR